MKKKFMSVLVVSIMLMFLITLVTAAKPIEKEIILNMNSGTCDDTVNIKTILTESFKNDNYVSLQTGESISCINKTLNGEPIEEQDCSPINLFIKPSIKGKANTAHSEWDNYYFSSYYMRQHHYEKWITPINVRIGKIKYIGELTTTKTDTSYYYSSGETYSSSYTISSLYFKNLEESYSLHGGLW